MALKNMIKLKDKVTFGRSGDVKRKGTVIQLNPKTAHVKCSNGDVMAVTYNLIQKTTARLERKGKKPSNRPRNMTGQPGEVSSKKALERWSIKDLTHWLYVAGVGVKPGTKKSTLVNSVWTRMRRGKAKKNPSQRTTAHPPGVSTPRKNTYAHWLLGQNKTQLKKLDKAYEVLLKGSGKGLSGLKAKHTEVKKELRKRK